MFIDKVTVFQPNPRYHGTNTVW